MSTGRKGNLNKLESFIVLHSRISHLDMQGISLFLLFRFVHLNVENTDSYLVLFLKLV